MADIRQEGRSQRSAPQKRHKAHQTRVETEAETGSGEVTLHLGRVRSSSSWFPGLRGRHKSQAQQSLHLCGVPRNLNLSSVQGRAHTRERGQTQHGRNTVRAPHTGQGHLPAAPLPPHSTAEQANLNKRPPPPACVRAETRHCRDLQTEAK